MGLGVFSPKYFTCSEILARNFPYNEGEDFLEVGCGVGVISTFAALKGAQSVLALDINPRAVRVAQKKCTAS